MLLKMFKGSCKPAKILSASTCIQDHTIQHLTLSNCILNYPSYIMRNSPIDVPDETNVV